jgi:hypothetical protein
MSKQDRRRGDAGFETSGIARAWRRSVRGDSVQNPRRHLTLNKGGERFVYRWEKGEEPGLLRVFQEHADDVRTSFDAFDAAVLGARLRRIVAVAGGATLREGP